jgi:hypothetical protein
MNDRDQKELITSISGVMPMLPLEKSIGRFIAKDTSAVSAVEFGLVAPLFLVFMLTVFDAGLGFYRKMQVENAAQAGAAYASQRGFDIGAIQSAVLNATNFSGHEGIVSGGEVNWLIDGLCGERLPAIDLAHVDLSGSEQRPEQHGRGVGRRQHGLGLDPPLELLVQPLDGVGRPRASPLARRQAGEGEQPVAGFLQAVGDGAVLEPPLADEGLAAASISSGVAA